jgi:hypothetical protein
MHTRSENPRRSDHRGELILANARYASPSAMPLASREQPAAAKQDVRALLTASFARPAAPDPEFASAA